MSKPQAQTYEEAISARAARQPVAQITGRRLFWGLPFRVTADTLDPRPETEMLVAEAVAQPFHKVLDLGTGTGCILLSCLHSMPMAQGLGVDVSAAALAVAAGNAAALGLDRRARFARSDWFSAVPGGFRPDPVEPALHCRRRDGRAGPEVREWEPHLALSPGGDGLDAYRAIARGAGRG